MDYIYKQLSKTDLTDLKALLKVFAVAFEDNETYQGAVPADSYLESFLARSHTLAVVANDGDEVVGGLVAYELEKYEQDRREIYRSLCENPVGLPQG